MSLSCLELAADSSNSVMEFIKIAPGVIPIPAFCLASRSYRLGDGPFDIGENVPRALALLCFIAVFAILISVDVSGLQPHADRIRDPGQFVAAGSLSDLGKLGNASLGSQPCGVLILDALRKVWAYLMSDDGHILFGALATGRAILYYRSRSPSPEARHFGDVLITGLLLSLLIIVLDSPIKDLPLECKAPKSRLHIIAPRD